MPRIRIAAAIALAATLLGPNAAGAQAQRASIDPGMSKAQVIERFGRPAVERTRGSYTYLFYANGVERTVGMNDLVILADDRVVDAVLRSPRRAYSGDSSSPKPIGAREAARARPTPSGASVPRS